MVDKATKLFAVEVEGTIMVVADDAHWAEIEAGGHLSDEADSMGFWAREIKSLDQIDREWLHNIPYGDNEDRDNCEQVFQKILALQDDPRQMKLEFGEE